MDSFKKKSIAKKAPKAKTTLTASAVAAAAAAPVTQKRAPAAPKKKAVVAKPVSAKPAIKTVSPEERFKMIEQAAYFRAEKHGFQVDPQANWVAAEKEVDAILAKGKK